MKKLSTLINNVFIGSAILCSSTSAFAYGNYGADFHPERNGKNIKIHDISCNPKGNIRYNKIEFRRVKGDLDFTRDYSPNFSIFEAPLWVNDILLISHISDDLLPNGATTTRGMGILFHEKGRTLEVSEAFFVEDAGANGMITNAKEEIIAGFQAFGAVVNLKNTWHVAMMKGEFVSEGYLGIRFNSPNDLARHTNGVLYITDRDLDSKGVPIELRQPEQRAYVIETNGVVTPIPSTPSEPDGIYLSKDEKKLYIGGTDGLKRYDVYPDGTIAGLDESYTLYDEEGNPAMLKNIGGMTMDCDGNIILTADEVAVALSEDNTRIAARYPIPGLVNLAFGGVKRNILLATTKTTVSEDGEIVPPQIYYSFVRGQGMPY